MRNLFIISLLIFLLLFTASSYSKQINILVDASKDGGAWWFGEPNHQGKAFSDYLKSKGYAVTELPKLIKITSEMLSKYDIVIRVNEFEKYSESEIKAYREFVDKGGRLLLLGDFVRPNDKDLLALSFGIRFQGITRGENIVSSFKPHPITKGVSPLAYIVGSGVTEFPKSAKIIGYVSKNTYLDLNDNQKQDADEPAGVPVLGEMRFGVGDIVFCGDTNMWQSVPQPLVDNTISWLLNPASVKDYGKLVSTWGNLKFHIPTFYEH